MCGANLASIAYYQARVSDRLRHLVDEQLAAHLRQELSEAQKVADKGDWESAEDMIYGTWDKLDTALEDQREADKVVAEVEEAMAEPVAEVEPTLHVEVDDEGKASTAKVKQAA